MINPVHNPDSAQTITPHGFTFDFSVSSIKLLISSGSKSKVNKIKTGVKRTVEIIICPFKVLSTLSLASTIITLVAKKVVIMLTKIPAAEIIKGKRKLYPVVNSGELAEIT